MIIVIGLAVIAAARHRRHPRRPRPRAAASAATIRATTCPSGPSSAGARPPAYQSSAATTPRLGRQRPCRPMRLQAGDPARADVARRGLSRRAAPGGRPHRELRSAGPSPAEAEGDRPVRDHDDLVVVVGVGAVAVARPVRPALGDQALAGQPRQQSSGAHGRGSSVAASGAASRPARVAARGEPDVARPRPGRPPAPATPRRPPAGRRRARWRRSGRRPRRRPRRRRRGSPASRSRAGTAARPTSAAATASERRCASDGMRTAVPRRLADASRR